MPDPKMKTRYGEMTPRGRLFRVAGSDSSANALVEQAMGKPDSSYAKPKKKKKRNRVRDSIIAKLKEVGRKIKGG